MKPIAFRTSRIAAGLAAIAATFGTLSGAWADASAWDKGSRSAVRLIDGAALREGDTVVLRAGIEIVLDPGWKTYWRYPGDSGVPPRIGFARSENVKDVTVLWPAPMRFSDGGGGESVGYAKRVVFPLRIVPQDTAKPVLLRADLDYGVCEKLCVPVDAKMELKVTGASTEHEALLREGEARVPRRAKLGEAKPIGVVAIRKEAGAPHAKVVVYVAAEAGADVDLFAEGPSAEWSLPLPKPVDGAPAGLRRFAFELDGLPPGAKADGAMLRFTATAGPQAVEVSAPLD